MSIVKMHRVQNLRKLIDYSLQEYKTISHLVTTNECQEPSIVSDFDYTLQEYNHAKNTNKEMFARMIYQSFDPEEKITPEQAHFFGVELAKRYLKNDHQYIVITHEETEHLHNHIIFNSIKCTDLKMFDSKTKHTKYDLRMINDQISFENGLMIPEIKANRGMSFNEYVVRGSGKSFKSKLEILIDQNIKQSNTFDEFLNNMKNSGYSYKRGKYLAFKAEDGKKYIRTKVLGMNYLESSIKFRIENKSYVPVTQRIIDKQWIDKTGKKFQTSFGLRRWATRKNINYLNEIGKRLYRENISLDQLNEKEEIKVNITTHFEKELMSRDELIYKLSKMENSFLVYKNSLSLISNFKKSEDREKFKRDNYQDFKAYDNARKNLNYLKKHHGITDLAELEYKVSQLKEERNMFYNSLDAKGQDTKVRENRRERSKEIIEKDR
ncbi:relaxase/mobilization nuclease domain-containing protein [Enterococcus sp. AZ196]|uniref:relaxase/mobilization nuclease domain-containing protein n=1 Tax=Enterococcus sp. AZ196 TaxID=2774659 RepID=UPI003D2686C0